MNRLVIQLALLIAKAHNIYNPRKCGKTDTNANSSYLSLLLRKTIVPPLFPL